MRVESKRLDCYEGIGSPMTNEERDKLMDFMIDQQINILDLNMVGLSTDKRIRSLVRTVRKHQEWLANNTFEIQALESTSSANPDPLGFFLIQFREHAKTLHLLIDNILLMRKGLILLWARSPQTTVAGVSS